MTPCSSVSVTVRPAFSAAAYITRSSTSWSRTACRTSGLSSMRAIDLPAHCLAQLFLALTQRLCIFAAR